jgi:hypothetical protein
MHAERLHPRQIDESDDPSLTNNQKRQIAQHTKDENQRRI